MHSWQTDVGEIKVLTFLLAVTLLLVLLALVMAVQMVQGKDIARDLRAKNKV
jgi:hypothetical protein